MFTTSSFEFRLQHLMTLPLSIMLSFVLAGSAALSRNSFVSKRFEKQLVSNMQTVDAPFVTFE